MVSSTRRLEMLHPRLECPWTTLEPVDGRAHGWTRHVSVERGVKGTKRAPTPGTSTLQANLVTLKPERSPRQVQQLRRGDFTYMAGFIDFLGGHIGSVVALLVDFLSLVGVYRLGTQADLNVRSGSCCMTQPLQLAPGHHEFRQTIPLKELCIAPASHSRSRKSGSSLCSFSKKQGFHVTLHLLDFGSRALCFTLSFRSKLTGRGLRSSSPIPEAQVGRATVLRASPSANLHFARS